MTLRFLFILDDDALSKLGSGTNLKVATIWSGTTPPGKVYGAFPEYYNSNEGYAYITSYGEIIVLNKYGEQTYNTTVNIIYV